MSLKGNISVTPGAGVNLLSETESDGSRSPVHYAYSGRYVPVKPSAYTAVAGATPGTHIAVSTSTVVDLMQIVPTGATRLLLYVSGQSVTFHDQGWDPIVNGQGGVIDADAWMEFANLSELTNLKFLGKSGTADLYMYWYATR